MVEPGTLPDGREATTPVVPVIVGEDWQAVLLWKALFDAGVYTNVAIHPAVPPGGALLRTSLMATHEQEPARSSPRDLRRGQGTFLGAPDGVGFGFLAPVSIRIEAANATRGTISMATRPDLKQNICS